jgi:hypothetical protein
VCADRNGELASRTAAEIEQAKGQAIPIQADPTAALDVQAAFGKVWEIFGSLTGVVHVTDFESATPFHHLGAAELLELFEETVHSTVLVLRAALRAAPGIWVVVVAPAPHPDQPHVAAVGGALARLAAAFPPPRATPLGDEAGLPDGPSADGLRVNVVVPSRSASDPNHDAPLAHAVRLLGGEAGVGIRGAEVQVALPPPPTVTEALLPEVQAALDDTARQSDDDTVWEPWGGDLVADEKLDDASLGVAEKKLDALMGQQETAAPRWRG